MCDGTKMKGEERVGHRRENIILFDLLTFHKHTSTRGWHACIGSHLSSVTVKSLLPEHPCSLLHSSQPLSRFISALLILFKTDSSKAALTTQSIRFNKSQKCIVCYCAHLSGIDTCQRQKTNVCSTYLCLACHQSTPPSFPVKDK